MDQTFAEMTQVRKQGYNTRSVYWQRYVVGGVESVEFNACSGIRCIPVNKTAISKVKSGRQKQEKCTQEQGIKQNKNMEYYKIWMV